MNSNNLSYRTRTSILLLKFINNSWRENKGNHYRERGLDVWFYNYHKIQWTFALIFSKNCQCFEKLYLSNTRKSVTSDTQTLRSWFKKRLGYALFFQPTSQCLDIWWNALTHFPMFDILHQTSKGSWSRCFNLLCQLFQ